MASADPARPNADLLAALMRERFLPKQSRTPGFEPVPENSETIYAERRRILNAALPDGTRSPNADADVIPLPVRRRAS